MTLGSGAVDFTQANSLTVTAGSDFTGDCVVTVWDDTHKALVKRLATGTLIVPNMPLQLAWDGTAEPSYLYAASNDRIPSGVYTVAVGMRSEYGGFVGWNETTVQATNDADLSGWTVIEAEAIAQQLALSGDWALGADVNASGIAVMLCSTPYPTASAQLTFQGNVAQLIYEKGPGLSAFSVYLDGAPLVEIDCAQADFLGGCVYTSPSVGPGTHVLSVRPVAGSNGYTGVLLDAFRVLQEGGE